MSIQNQTFKNYEVCIINNASNDGTLEYLQTLEKPFYWISEPDKGVYDAMNKGISLAKGEWLYFLGADDRLINKATLATLFSKPILDQTKILIGKIKYDWKEKDSIFIKRKDGLVTSSWSKKLWIKNSSHHQSLFYRKELFTTRKYSLKYKILADYALNLHLYKKGVKIRIVDETITVCGTKGLSKRYNWNLYKEEIELKTDESSLLLKPLFFLIAFVKYILKKSNV